MRWACESREVAALDLWRVANLRSSFDVEGRLVLGDEAATDAAPEAAPEAAPDAGTADATPAAAADAVSEAGGENA